MDMNRRLQEREIEVDRKATGGERGADDFRKLRRVRQLTFPFIEARPEPTQLMLPLEPPR